MDHLQSIKHYVAKNFLFTEDESAVTDHESLITKGVVDSTGILELIAHLEESFGISVEHDEMLPENFDSVAAIAAFVRRKLSS